MPMQPFEACTSSSGGLVGIVSSPKSPRSQAYGEQRCAHAFGRPIKTLLRAGMIEYRAFRGRGRGGNITKVRVVYERESIHRLIERLGSSSELNRPPIGESKALRTRLPVIVALEPKGTGHD